MVDFIAFSIGLVTRRMSRTTGSILGGTGHKRRLPFTNRIGTHSVSSCDLGLLGSTQTLWIAKALARLIAAGTNRRPDVVPY